MALVCFVRITVEHFEHYNTFFVIRGLTRNECSHYARHISRDRRLHLRLWIRDNQEAKGSFGATESREQKDSYGCGASLACLVRVCAVPCCTGEYLLYRNMLLDMKIIPPSGTFSLLPSPKDVLCVTVTVTPMDAAASRTLHDERLGFSNKFGSYICVNLPGPWYYSSAHMSKTLEDPSFRV
jgi:hypothetical protein